MTVITSVVARQILDCKARPMVEVEIGTADGAIGRAAAPTGSSVGVHESAVSRATANKFVMLPTRQVIPFSDFFTPSLSVKDMIKEMIDQEEQSLTDKRIVELLNRRGVRIARRTVAKYRAELNILPSTLR